MPNSVLTSSAIKDVDELFMNVIFSLTKECEYFSTTLRQKNFYIKYYICTFIY